MTFYSQLNGLGIGCTYSIFTNTYYYVNVLGENVPKHTSTHMYYIICAMTDDTLIISSLHRAMNNLKDFHSFLL